MLSSNLLVLKGVYFDDFKSKSLYDEKVVQPQKTLKTKLPKIFRSADEWSSLYSNLRCWECGLIPVSYPKFIPENPRSIDGEEICNVNTHFCEWTCVIRYIYHNYHPTKATDLIKIVLRFESLFSGQLRHHIEPALPKTDMAMYRSDGGLSEDEFRERNKKIESEFGLSTWKMEHLC